MPDMINGVHACYGCISFGAICIQCSHKEGCKEYREELNKSWKELLRHGTRRKL